MEEFKIRNVKAREVLDLRGLPTIEVDVVTDEGAMGRASAPGGTSIGNYEALELRDGGDRYGGRGVRQAVQNVNNIIAPKLVGKDVRRQREIDTLMIQLDGTKNKSKLGGNTIYATSLSVAQAAAEAVGIPFYRYVGGVNCCTMPVPMLVAIHGGRAIGGNDLDFEDHIFVPIGAKSFSEAIQFGAEVYFEFRKVLQAKYGKSAVGSVAVTGTYVPPMKDEREALDSMMKALQETGYADKFGLGLDATANSLYDQETSKYTFMGKKMNRGDLIEVYKDLVSTYPIISIEDPFAENDFEGFVEITRKLDIQIVGDDIFVTNVERLMKGIEMGAANALLFKVNQVGTLSEALDAAECASRNGYGVEVSGRTGDAEDTTLADITVGINAKQIKIGGLDKMFAKYNRFLRIEEQLGSLAKYPKEL